MNGRVLGSNNLDPRLLAECCKLVLRSAPEWIGIPIEEYRFRLGFFYEPRKLFDSPSFSNYQPCSSCRQV
jgi:hypothetical protein